MVELLKIGHSKKEKKGWTNKVYNHYKFGWTNLYNNGGKVKQMFVEEFVFYICKGYISLYPHVKILGYIG
jgi:hypothetical protein